MESKGPRFFLVAQVIQLPAKKHNDHKGMGFWKSDQNAAWKTPHLNLPMETLEVFLFFVLSPELLWSWAKFQVYIGD